MSHIATIERFIAHGVRAGNHFIGMWGRAHDGLFVQNPPVLVVDDPNVHMIGGRSEYVLDLYETFVAEQGARRLHIQIQERITEEVTLVYGEIINIFPIVSIG